MALKIVKSEAETKPNPEIKSVSKGLPVKDIVSKDAAGKKSPIKTVVIWNNGCIRFFVVDGDWTHLNHKYMDGQVSEKESEQIFNLAYEEINKSKKLKVTMIKEFPTLAVLNGAKVVVTGYLP